MFDTYTAAQYRGMDGVQLEERMAAVLEELETSKEGIATDVLDEQARLIEAEMNLRSKAAELRKFQMKAVAAGEGKVLDSRGASFEDEDPYDTPEYRNAFMDFVCRGDKRVLAMQKREDASTLTTDVPVMIPTVLMNEIIEKLENYGEIYAGVRKLNVQGGIEFPVIELAPEAYWVGEEEISEYQKLVADEKVTFSYYELECRLSQSWLASIVTFAKFQSMFVPAATKAMIKKLDASIISGTGEGQFLGILNDERITNTVEMSATDVIDWKKWISKVDAAILEEYQDGTFIMSKGTWDGCIRVLADDNNAPVYEGYNPVNGVMERRLMGRPVLFTKQLPSFDTAEDEDVFVIYGRLDDYAINSNQTMQTYQWMDPNDRKKKVLAYMVADGKVLDPYGWLLVAKESL